MVVPFIHHQLNVGYRFTCSDFIMYNRFVHILADKDRYCDYNGSLCVSNQGLVERVLDYNNNVEPCLPSCNEMDIRINGFVCCINSKTKAL